MKVFAVLLPLVVVAGCGDHAQPETVRTAKDSSQIASPRTPLPSDADIDWNRLFYHPRTAENIISNLGFPSNGYGPMPLGGGPPNYLGTFLPREISEPVEGNPNAIDVAIAGDNGDTINEVDFTLWINSPSRSAQSKKIFSGLLVNFLQDNNLSGIKQVVQAIADEKDSDIPIGNAVLTVKRIDRSRSTADARDLELFFHRPGVAPQVD